METKLYALKYESELSPQERSSLCLLLGYETTQRVKQYHKLADQDRSLLGEYLAKMLINGKTDIDVSDLSFKRLEFGKPFCPEASEIHFNISHAGEWIICGISDNPIGVDVEQIIPVKRELFCSVLTAHEQLHCSNRSVNEMSREFFRYWSIKESIVKALGQGFAISPLNLEIDLQSLPIRYEASQIDEQFHITEFSLSEGYSCITATSSVLSDADFKIIDINNPVFS